MEVYKKVIYMAKKMAEEALLLLYPPRCPICDSVIAVSQQPLCPACRAGLQVIQEPFCMKCGKKLGKADMEYCGDCRLLQHEFKKGRSLLIYDKKVAHSIYRFKYDKRAAYAKAYAMLMAEHLGEYIRGINPDAIIPIPLHKKRMRQRGYNQAGLLAKEIAARTGCVYNDRVLVRTKNTAPLKQMTRQMRQKNLKRAFKIKENDVKLNTIILVDDIYTTGATMDEAAAALKQGGARNVYCLTIAHGKEE